VLLGTLLLSPVFLQEFLGYSAWKAGLVQAQRGTGAMTSMMLVGNLARVGIDTRKFIRLGFILVAIGC
jgi:DHA2 family multidrug resistance protein